MAKEPKNKKNSVDRPPVQSTLFSESATSLTTVTSKKPLQKPISRVFDYSKGQVTKQVEDLIAAHISMEKNSAKEAGTIGFMARSLTIATLPHSRPADNTFRRHNGHFTLNMSTSNPDGLPYGSLPRLLLNWVCTEAVKTQSRELELGASMSEFMDSLGLHRNGQNYARLKWATATLFSTMISCSYEGEDSWQLTNMTLADNLELRGNLFHTPKIAKENLDNWDEIEKEDCEQEREAKWWEPLKVEETNNNSRLILTENFFKECIDRPVPVDVRAMKALKKSPLALDIYSWLTYRFSYLSSPTRPTWHNLAMQIGANYNTETDQGLRDFKKAFLKELKKVLVVYPKANITEYSNGLILHPSPTHIPRALYQSPKSPL